MIGAVKKELRPGHESVTCEVCGRTILKGERTEAFLAPGGRRHEVCELCFARAEHHGWIRERGGNAPSRAGVGRSESRRPMLDRLLGRGGNRTPVQPPEEELDEHEPVMEDGDQPEHERTHAPPPIRRDARHVRAVPTTAEVKVERALELFNGSDHARTVSGLVRTLGPPWVSARADIDAPSAVTVVVAWELSWYRFKIDLGDEEDPVVLVQKGEEVREIEEELRDWNATVDTDGRLVAGVGSERAG
jgi:hypothetical protein